MTSAKKYLFVIAIFCTVGLFADQQLYPTANSGAFFDYAEADFFWIVPEPGCPAAGELYALRPMTEERTQPMGLTVLSSQPLWNRFACSIIY